MTDALRSALRFVASMVSSARPASTSRRRIRLELEGLETRALLSATGLSVPSATPQFTVTPLAQVASAPYTPTQVRHAYGFDKLPYNGAGETIAIVDAYDDPKIQSDLHTFDGALGLPDPSFVKATPQGKPATANSGWSGEADLDVEWAHAIAPQAKILFVEALSSSDADLRSAVDYARRQPGVVVVSMSWGGSEFSGELGYDSTFSTPAGHAGVAFVASTGDSGAGAQWPAVSPNVLAVGGTSLTIAPDGTRISESAWSSGGGGLSKYEPEPSFQQPAQTSGKRSTPDVAYNADTNKGYYVYVGAPAGGGPAAWYSYGGTSAGAPQWAALIALADQGRAAAGLGSLSNIPAAIYSLPKTDFNDITAGSNGLKANAGYDLVTGLGAPQANLVIGGLVKYGVVAPAAHTTVPAQTSVKTAAKQPAATSNNPGTLPTAPTNRAAEILTELLRELQGSGKTQWETEIEALLKELLAG